MSLVSSFYFISTLMLIYNTLKDIKKGMVDERHNYLALGATYMIMSQLKPGLLWIMILILISVLIQSFAKKLLAEGDMLPITWIVLAFGSISIMKLLMWLWFWIIFTVFWVFIMKRENLKHAPYYPVFLISYVFAIFA